MVTGHGQMARSICAQPLQAAWLLARARAHNTLQSLLEPHAGASLLAYLLPLDGLPAPLRFASRAALCLAALCFATGRPRALALRAATAGLLVAALPLASPPPPPPRGLGLGARAAGFPPTLPPRPLVRRPCHAAVGAAAAALARAARAPPPRAPDTGSGDQGSWRNLVVLHWQGHR